jgi:hypothetical protein
MRSSLLALLLLAACTEDPPPAGTDAGTEDTGDDYEVVDPGDIDDGDIDEHAEPQVAVEPGALSFGAVDVGTAETQTLRISNTGDADLRVSDVYLEDGDPLSVSWPAPTELAPGAGVDVTVTFAPISSGQVSDVVYVESDDPDEAILEVPVLGTGQGGSLSMGLSPYAWDFHTLTVGCDAEQGVEIENTGSGALTISTLAWEASSGELSFEPRTDHNGALPWTLSPGQTKTVVLAYRPLDELDDAGTLTVQTTVAESTWATLHVAGAGALWGEETERFVGTGDQRAFPLSTWPVPDSIEITGVGSLGWAYDASSNAILFDAGDAPFSGLVFDVRYALFGDCDR